MCKDFFVDPYQVYLAKSFGADAILIILAGVSDQIAKEALYKASAKLPIKTKTIKRYS